MDDAEYADNQYQIHFAARIKEIRSHPLELHNPSQQCWECGFKTETTQHRWCCNECRDVWQKEQ